MELFRDFWVSIRVEIFEARGDQSVVPFHYPLIGF